MNWININIETINSVEFIASEPTERSTWLSLLAWCCLQENGGIIKDCLSWKSRMWQQICGVTLEEINADCGLFRFEGENMVIAFYPLTQEAAVGAKREAGKKGGRPKALKNKEEKPLGLTMVNHEVKDTLNEKERKGIVIVKERKEKKSKEWGELPFSSSAFSEAWNEWMTHLQQKRKTPTTLASEMQLKKLGKMNESDAIVMIYHSIEGNYQGLYSPSGNAGQANTSAQNPNQYR